MVEKDGSWERLWGKSGHPRFINRRRRWPHNIVVIHVSSIKKMPPSLLKHILAVLGWTEPWLRRKGFVK